MIKTIIVRAEEALPSIESYKSVYQEKYYKWIDEAFDNGCLIEVLRMDFYNKAFDNNQYCDIEFRTRTDEIHLEVLERLTIGL